MQGDDCVHLERGSGPAKIVNPTIMVAALRSPLSASTPFSPDNCKATHTITSYALGRAV